LRSLLGYYTTITSLEFSLAEAPTLQQAFEATVANRKPGEYVGYLEKANRTDEVVECFRTQPAIFPEEARYPFFTRHKMRYPVEALPVFVNVLEQNLANAHSKSYDKAIEILRHIQPLVEPEIFERQVSGLQTKYLRRRAFVDKLIAAFGKIW